MHIKYIDAKPQGEEEMSEEQQLSNFANEFDITAVKMIILSGGKAVRVKSRRKNCNIL